MSNYGFTSAGASYDDEDRLTGFARASGTFTQSWSLTSVGDWNSITTNGTAQNRTHFLTHLRHLCPDCSPAVLSSTLTPQTSRLSYDFDNKLKSADVDNNGSNDVTFQYDALGRRVARQGTSGSFVYVQQDPQTIADYGYGDAPSSPTHRYVYASYIDEPVVRKAAGTSGTIHYLHRNQQYSITAVTTSSGSVAERYAYTAYGQPAILDGSGSVLSSSAINNRYTYTGREWDQTLGLYHFRARWMSGLAGRFLWRDPIGHIGSDWNLYEYVKSRPLIELDPSGKCPKGRSEEWKRCDELAVICYGIAFAGCAIDLLEFAVCASSILPHWDEPCTWIPFAPAGSPARIACCAAHHGGECLIKLGLSFCRTSTMLQGAQMLRKSVKTCPTNDST